jgi:O-antigen/teichoic acid export membrane protein
MTHSFPESAHALEKPAVPPLSLRRNFSWTVMGNASYAACQWAILVVLAKFCYAQQVGEFALGLAVTAPVFMFLNLQLRSVQTTDAKCEYAFPHYFGLRLVTTSFALLAISALVYWMDYRAEAMWVIFIVGFAKAIESLSDLLYGLLQRHERLDWIAQSMILKGTLSVGLLAIAVMASGSLIWGLIAMAATWAGVLLLYDVPRGLRILSGLAHVPWSLGPGHIVATMKPNFQRRILGRLAWLALPLGFVTLLSSLNVNIPRYFIEAHLGSSTLGIFVAILAVFSGIYFVQIALCQTALPRLARYHADGMTRHFLRIAGVVLGFCLFNGMVAVAVAIIGGSNLLRLIYSEEFVAHDRLFVWLAVVSTARCLSGTLAYFLQAARHFRKIAWVSLVNVIVILICSAWFVPRFGEVGGAYAMLVGSSVSSLIYAILFILILYASKENSHAARAVLSATCKTGRVSYRSCPAPVPQH